MPSAVDARRLRDGARAMECSLKEPETLEEMEEQLRILRQGAVALQSTDDLGSPAANEATWNNMLELQRSAEALEKRIAKLRSARKK